MERHAVRANQCKGLRPWGQQRGLSAAKQAKSLRHSDKLQTHAPVTRSCSSAGFFWGGGTDNCNGIPLCVPHHHTTTPPHHTTGHWMPVDTHWTFDLYNAPEASEKVKKCVCVRGGGGGSLCF